MSILSRHLRIFAICVLGSVVISEEKATVASRDEPVSTSPDSFVEQASLSVDRTVLMLISHASEGNGFMIDTVGLTDDQLRRIESLFVNVLEGWNGKLAESAREAEIMAQQYELNGQPGLAGSIRLGYLTEEKEVISKGLKELAEILTPSQLEKLRGMAIQCQASLHHFDAFQVLAIKANFLLVGNEEHRETMDSICESRAEAIEKLVAKRRECIEEIMSVLDRSERTVFRRRFGAEIYDLLSEPTREVARYKTTDHGFGWQNPGARYRSVQNE